MYNNNKEITIEDGEGEHKRTTTKIEGLVEKLEHGKINVTSISGGINKIVNGTYLIIKSGKGLYKLEFPRNFSEEEKIMLKKVEYSKNTSSYGGHLNLPENLNYDLKILNGPYKNWELKVNINFKTK
jgi:hypothetical protein